MKETPYVEVFSSPDGTLERGRRIPFGGVVGRSPSADVNVPLGTIARQHCRLFIEKGRMYIEDFRSTNGTFLNGVSRFEKAELAPGDWIELPWGIVLRVPGGPSYELDEADPFVRQVLDAPHEDGRWRVWADALLERGHPLGERIAHGRGADVAEDAKALGPLAREFVDGSLEVEWRHGFIRRAVLRNRSQWPPMMWTLAWRMLLEHPLARFIEELEVDALSYTRGVERNEDVLSTIVASLDELAKAKPLALVHSVRFGPSPGVMWSPQLEGVWRRSTTTHPKLRTGPIWVARAAWLQLLATPPGVTVTGLELGAQRKLMEDGANLVGPTDDCAFALEAPEGSPSSQVALRLDRENGLWVAEDMAADRRRNELPLYVNGRRCTHHRMRPQDLLEPAPGLLFRFVME